MCNGDAGSSGIEGHRDYTPWIIAREGWGGLTIEYDI